MREDEGFEMMDEFGSSARDGGGIARAPASVAGRIIRACTLSLVAVSFAALRATGAAFPTDIDADGVADESDNCLEVANADQRDTDADGFGNRCDPDLNNDGVVNFTDLGVFKPLFFGTDPNADFDGNGSVNFSDLGIMKAFFFAPPGPILIRWANPVSGDWNDPANWLPAVLPAPVHAVRIDAPDSVVTHASGSTHIASLIGNSRLVISGGTFEATTTMQVDNVLELRGTGSGSTLRNARVLAPDPGGLPDDGVLVPSSQHATLDHVTLMANLRLENAALVTVTNGLTLDGATVTLAATGGSTTLSFTGASGGSSTLGGAGEVVFDGTGSDSLDVIENATNGHTLYVGPDISVRSGARGGRVGSTASARATIIQGSVLAETAARTITLSGNPLTLAGSVTGLSGANVTIMPAGTGSSIDVPVTMSGGGKLAVNASGATWTLASTGSLSNAGGEIELLGNWTSQGSISVTDGLLDIGAGDSEQWVNAGTIALIDTPTELGGFVSVAALGDFDTNDVVTLTGAFDNTGQVLDVGTLFPGGTFQLGGEIDGGTLTGTPVVAVGGGAALDGVTLEADLSIGNGVAVTVRNGLTLSGATVTLASNGASSMLSFTGTGGGSSTLGGTGEVVFDGTGSDNVDIVDNASTSHTLVIGPGITVRSGARGGRVGSTISTRATVVEGSVRADTAGRTITVAGAPLTIEGLVHAGAGSVVNATTDYTLTAGAQVHVDIGGTATSQYGRFTASGLTADLDGALDLALVDGFAPGLADTFQVMTFGASTGAFAALSGADIGGGLAFEANYDATGVTLEVVPGP